METEKNDSCKKDGKNCDDKDYCANFKKNPLKALVPPAICLAVAACTAPIVWSIVFVDYHLFFRSGGSPFSAAFFMIALALFMCFPIGLFRESRNDPDKGKLRAISIAMIGVAVLTLFLVTRFADRYSWIENKAVSSLNNNHFYGIEKKCTGVEISRNLKDSYFGEATLSDGSTVPVVVTYRLLKWIPGLQSVIYRVSVEFQ